MRLASLIAFASLVAAFDLLTSAFAQSLKDNDPQAMLYLTTAKSVPAFLSHITLALFEQQTFLG